MPGGSTLDTALYGYVPSKGLGFAFVIIYALTAAAHTFQSMRVRAWWLLPTVTIAALGETVGWAARLQSAYDPRNTTPFTVQTILLVLAPTPLVAALFIGFGRIVDRLGSQYSRLSPRFYSRIFLTCDITSLLVQGLGGGICAAATSSDTIDETKLRVGSNIVLGGLVFQIFCMSIFCVLMTEYALRRSKNRPFRKPEPGVEATLFVFDTNMKRLVGGICFATILVYIRSVYRMIEFVQGFNGSLAHNQVTFAIFDGTLVALALIGLNFCHPGRLLLRVPEQQSIPLADKETAV